MSGNPLVNGWNDSGSGYPQPYSPTYGSLPTFAPPPYSVIFKLVPAESSILNCTVMGMNGQCYLTVCSSDAITTFSRRAVELCASVEWQKHAVVEWNNCVPRQRVSHWAPLASDRRQRSINVNQRVYDWVPRTGSICLYTRENQSTAPVEIARITQGVTPHAASTLQIIVSSFNTPGMFEACVLSAVLFLCGKNID